MITVNIRKQGGTVIMTIPADVLKMLNVDVGATLELEVINGMFTARPVHKAARKHYTLAELNPIFHSIVLTRRDDSRTVFRP